MRHPQITMFSDVSFHQTTVLKPKLNFMFGLFSNAKKKKIQDYLQQDAQLLDVRSSTEFSQGSLEGSIHAPIQQLDQHMDKLDKSRPVVTYCAMGGRSAIAATKLRAQGFKVVDAQGMKFVRRFLNKLKKSTAS